MSSSTALLTSPAWAVPARVAHVDIVVPVYKEQGALAASIRRLHE